MEKFLVGESASLTRLVTAQDVESFARVSGDNNPVHLDAAYAATTRFKQRIAHGMLTASYISALLGSRFPGPGTIYLKQELAFLRPVYLGDTIEVHVTVTQYRSDKQILTLSTDCVNQHAEKVISGEAVCLVADVERT